MQIQERGESTRRFVVVALLLIMSTLIASCALAPPRQPKNLCAIFRERPDWYEASRRSYRKWGVPIPLQLAVMQRESSFEADARPARTWYFGFIPGSRPSTAYGYGQVLDGTWARYQRATGNSWADRNDFSDVVDFMGWYGRVGQRDHGISRVDAGAFYASYHVGHTGYRRGAHRGNATAQRATRDVRRRNALYAEQYRSCQKELDDLIDGPWWWPF